MDNWVILAGKFLLAVIALVIFYFIAMALIDAIDRDAAAGIINNIRVATDDPTHTGWRIG